MEDARAGDVGRHEIGGELDPGEPRAENVGQRPHEERLADTRHAFDEGMLATEDRDEGQVDNGLLPHDHPAHFRPRPFQNVLHPIQRLTHASPPSAIAVRDLRARSSVWAILR